MNRAVNITRAACAAAQARGQIAGQQLAGSVIVLACAAALILAQKPLPL